MSMQFQNLNSLRHIKGRLGSKGNFTPLKNAVGLDQLISTEKITIKCCNTLVNTHALIWPWHFSAELKNELALRGLIVPLKPRQLINNYDIRQMEIVFLLKGSIKLESPIPGLKYNILDLYFAGETIATSDIDGSSNRLSSLTDSFIYVLTKKHFFAISKIFPELFEFANYLKDNSLIRTQRRQLIIGNFSAERRLAWFLVNACKKLKMPMRGTFVLKLPMSRVEISDFLNMSPETLSRSLQALDGKGVIQTTKNKITIVDYLALAAS